MQETQSTETEKRVTSMDYAHSRHCTWSGKKGARYTVEAGKCRACDRIKDKNSLIAIESLPQNSFGLDKATRDALYCLNSRMPWAKCTKHTNPSCACGKLVLNQISFKVYDEERAKQ